MLQWWNKIVKDLKKLIHSKVPRYRKKRCKENWNELKFNYKKILDYHKGIGHHVHNYGKWPCKSVTSAIILTNWTHIF